MPPLVLAIGLDVVTGLARLWQLMRAGNGPRMNYRIPPARVARVGRRVSRKTSPPPSQPIVKVYLRHLAKALLLAVAVSFIGVFALLLIPASETKVYDCSIAEFHPDVSPAVKNACRNRKNV
jgi:hypothetical protein